MCCLLVLLFLKKIGVQFSIEIKHNTNVYDDLKNYTFIIFQNINMTSMYATFKMSFLARITENYT